MRRSLWVFVALACMSGCANFAHSSIRPERVEIRVKAIGSDRWVVNITLPTPSTRLVFLRTPSVNIRARWKIKDPSKHLQTENGRDLIVSERAFTSVTLEVPADDRFIRADYSLTQSFEADNGTVLYLGHFIAAQASACPDSRNTKPPCPADLSVRFHISPAEHQSVWLGGQLHQQPFYWQQAVNRGAFAYFGNVEPRDEGDWRMLIAPSVPTWMTEHLAEFAPRLTALYAKWYGQPLTLTPQLLFSVRSGDGYDASGGVVDDMVQFTLSGDAWQHDNAFTRARYFYLIAHEAAHFWNGSMYSHDHASGESWLHEGNADAFARRAAIELGMMDQATLWTNRTQSFNTCLEASSRPLNDAGNTKRFDLYYPCGETIELIVEGALREQGLDPSAHWLNMFSGLQGDYSAQAYFDSVVELTGRQDIVTALNTLVNEGFAHPNEFKSLLDKVGIQSTGISEAVADNAIRTMLRHLHKIDCSGSFSITGRDRSYTLLHLEQCSVTPTHGMQVTHIAGFDVQTELSKIYQAMQLACNSQQEITLTGTSADKPASVSISCNHPFQYLQLTGWQL